MSKTINFFYSEALARLFSFTGSLSSSSTIQVGNIMINLHEEGILSEALWSKGSRTLTAANFRDISSKLVGYFSKHTTLKKYEEYIKRSTKSELSKALISQEEFFKYLHSANHEIELYSFSKSKYSLSGMVAAWLNNYNLNDGDKIFFITRVDCEKPFLESVITDPIKISSDTPEIIMKKIEYGLITKGGKIFTMACSNGSHWSLLAIDPSINKFRYVDSLGSSCSSKNLITTLNELGFEELSISPVRQQSDSVSCGLWTIINASTILKSGLSARLVTYNDRDLDQFRRENELIFQKLAFQEILQTPPEQTLISEFSSQTDSTVLSEVHTHESAEVTVIMGDSSKVEIADAS